MSLQGERPNFAALLPLMNSSEHALFGPGIRECERMTLTSSAQCCLATSLHELRMSSSRSFLFLRKTRRFSCTALVCLPHVACDVFAVFSSFLVIEFQFPGQFSGTQNVVFEIATWLRKYPQFHLQRDFVIALQDATIFVHSLVRTHQVLLQFS
ncbi:unnamed protein product [Strongylus vulgaris]|uniref:Uncharacterized protein n=1 Tax=Strongylus vulgaris TaxID=40348 RepID=A0A3P7LQ35_STRVU|nr:unnamed protein product [Strongylus vulgaris]